jgi:hypothetical protein
MRAEILDAATGRAVTLSSGHHDVIVSDTATSVKCATLPELMGVLGTLAPAAGPPLPAFARRPSPASGGDALLLLALSARWPEFTVDESRYHLTLAYALPLALDRAWREWAGREADGLVRGRQLVAVPASHLVAVEPAGNLERRHRRLLRQHAASGTRVREHEDHGAFLSHWSAFSQRRYDTALTQDEREALRTVLAMSGCTVREFTCRGEVIARSVVCRHEPSRTIFDLMATWEPRHARYRPGVYSGVCNILDAARQGCRYSLCYGQFAYKDDIVGTSRRLALSDLMSGQASAGLARREASL